MNLTRRSDSLRNAQIRLASHEEIVRVEKALGPDCRLPEDYVEFLLAFNGGSFNESVILDAPQGPLVAAQFLSLSDDDEYSVLESLRHVREFLPPNSLPFAEDPGGNVFFIDTGRENGGVVYFWHHERRTVEKIAESFSSFVERLRVDE